MPLSYTIPLTFNGRTRTLNEWADDYGLNRGTLYTRIVRLRWPVEKALTEPVGPRNNGAAALAEWKRSQVRTVRPDPPPAVRAADPSRMLADADEQEERGTDAGKFETEETIGELHALILRRLNLPTR